MVRKIIIRYSRDSRNFNSLPAALALIVLSTAGLFAAERLPLSGDVVGGLDVGEYLVKTVLTVPAGDTLRVGAGTVMYFEQLTGIDVRGVLTLQGALGLPVVMTSCGDTTGAAEAPRAFDWNGVRTFGADAALRMRHAVVGNSVYGVNIGDTLSSVELREVVFKNNGYASVVRAGEIVPIATDGPVSAAWNADTLSADKFVKPAKKKRKVNVKFIVNASALTVAAAGLTTCYVGLSNTDTYHRHSVSDGNASGLSEYYREKINKNITVSAVGAVAAGLGLGCMGVTLFF
ncbi:MAG: hypothetical protein LBB74_05690 [Chitinispirillales bacterium]|jgi:hypothetical protein|nr:hypothetical protein [Chitinispirillales bacterium]